jgi:hypothetical protein
MNKKPTMKEMKNVVTNLILHVQTMEAHIQRMDAAFYSYVEFTGKSKEFTNWVTKQAEEAASAGQTTGTSSEGNSKDKG